MRNFQLPSSSSLSSSQAFPAYLGFQRAGVMGTVGAVAGLREGDALSYSNIIAQKSEDVKNGNGEEKN